MTVSARVAAATLVVATGLSVAAPARAFGPTGHRIVGHVADAYLCTETRSRLKPLLGGRSLAEAGTWPDGIRQKPEWQHTRPWHYLNVSDRGSVARAAGLGPDNVLAALARFEAELADASLNDRQRGIALRFVTHFVADIHQPLHVGLESDRGGNRVAVLVGKRTTSLHAVWDAELLGVTGALGPRAWARRQVLPAAGEARALQQADPLAWARESQALRRRVYAFPRAGTGPFELSAAYLESARALTAERLLLAGVRLAGRLNAAFKAPAGCAAEVASGAATH